MKTSHTIPENPMLREFVWNSFLTCNKIAKDRLNWLRDSLLEKATPTNGWYQLDSVYIIVFKDLTILAHANYVLGRGYKEGKLSYSCQSSWYRTLEWQPATDSVLDSIPDLAAVHYQAKPWDNDFKQCVINVN